MIRAENCILPQRKLTLQMVLHPPHHPWSFGTVHIMPDAHWYKGLNQVWKLRWISRGIANCLIFSQKLQVSVIRLAFIFLWHLKIKNHLCIAPCVIDPGTYCIVLYTQGPYSFNIFGISQIKKLMTFLGEIISLCPCPSPSICRTLILCIPRLSGILGACLGRGSVKHRTIGIFSTTSNLMKWALHRIKQKRFLKMTPCGGSGKSFCECLSLLFWRKT